MMDKKKIIFEVEYEPARIRHAYVICPECNRKFYPADINSDNEWPRDDYDLKSSSYRCPICEAFFCVDRGFTTYMSDASTYDYEIKEVPYPKCAEGVMQRKEVWE